MAALNVALYAHMSFLQATARCAAGRTSPDCRMPRTDNVLVENGRRYTPHDQGFPPTRVSPAAYHPVATTGESREQRSRACQSDLRRLGLSRNHWRRVGQE
jgi:hypothetical protein